MRINNEYSMAQIMALIAAAKRRGHSPEYEAELENRLKLEQERQEDKIQTERNRQARKALRKGPGKR